MREVGQVTVSDADIRSRVHIDRAGGTITFERHQDVAPILDSNKQLEQIGQKGDFRHIATIPNVIIEQWMNESGAPILGMSRDEFARFIKRKIDDPDNAYLRTAPRLKPLAGRVR